MLLEIVVGVALIFVAYLDWKFKEVPSFITTTIILACIMIYPQNIVWGIAGFVFGLILYEFDFSGNRYFGGIADIKVVAILGFFIPNMVYFAGMMLLVGLSGLGAVIINVVYYKSKKATMPEEFPFIPVLFIDYLLVIMMVNLGAFL